MTPPERPALHTYLLRQPEFRHLEIVTACPGCGVRAEIAERSSPRDIEGFIEHIAVDCAAGHHCGMPADRPPCR